MYYVCVTLQVLKVGMPTRVSYTQLTAVLQSHAAEANKLFANEPETALIAAILWACAVPSEAFRLGKTKVFFRAGQIGALEIILRHVPRICRSYKISALFCSCITDSMCLNACLLQQSAMK
jgi:myosin heavy subunit